MGWVWATLGVSPSLASLLRPEPQERGTIGRHLRNTENNRSEPMGASLLGTHRGALGGTSDSEEPTRVAPVRDERQLSKLLLSHWGIVDEARVSKPWVVNKQPKLMAGAEAGALT